MIQRQSIAVILAVLLGISGQVFAQQTAPRSAAAKVATPALHNVLASVTLDINDDATFDRAVLVAGDDPDADLYIFLGDPKGGDTRFKPAFLKKAVAFHGDMGGQMASLVSTGKGSLVVKSLNEGIGRNRWEQSLTIAWRNGTFVVAGLTYMSRDTLDHKAGGTCDVNFLAGRAVRNGKPFAEKIEPLKLADWDQAKLPKACTFE